MNQEGKPPRSLHHTEQEEEDGIDFLKDEIIAFANAVPEVRSEIIARLRLIRGSLKRSSFPGHAIVASVRSALRCEGREIPPQPDTLDMLLPDLTVAHLHLLHTHAMRLAFDHYLGSERGAAPRRMIEEVKKRFFADLNRLIIADPYAPTIRPLPIDFQEELRPRASINLDAQMTTNLYILISQGTIKRSAKGNKPPFEYEASVLLRPARGKDIVFCFDRDERGRVADGFIRLWNTPVSPPLGRDTLT